MKPEEKDIKKVKEAMNKIKSLIEKVERATIDAGKAIKRESIETKDASIILMKVIKGKEVSDEEVTFLKKQSIDVGKVLALIGLQAIPGSNVAIIALEKFGQKHGFSVFPTAQEPLIKEENEQK